MIILNESRSTSRRKSLAEAFRPSAISKSDLRRYGDYVVEGVSDEFTIDDDTDIEIAYFSERAIDSGDLVYYASVIIDNTQVGMSTPLSKAEAARISKSIASTLQGCTNKKQAMSVVRRSKDLMSLR